MIRAHLLSGGRPCCSPDPGAPILGTLTDQPEGVTCPECRATDAWAVALGEAEVDPWTMADACGGEVEGLPCPERATWYDATGRGLCDRCTLRRDRDRSVYHAREVLTVCLDPRTTQDTQRRALAWLLRELGGPVAT